jgi:hypothetical protein
MKVIIEAAACHDVDLVSSFYEEQESGVVAAQTGSVGS